mmetsp:Transcript_36948/g.94380  ORF Transcript_36948/g.94380 Transcript_36948/m.94380 type:complete len:527 (+) Transcript_36948:565-2145(+)
MLVLIHRVLESPCSVHDGDGAVALRIHLRQTAWLVPRRHEENISTRDNLVLHLRRKAHVPTHPALVLRLGGAHELGVFGIATAHHDDLRTLQYVSTVHDPVEALLEDVDAFLGRKAPDEGDQGSFGVHIQTQRGLDVRLAKCLARAVFDAVLANEMLVGHWIPFIGIDTVEDSVETALTRANLFLKAPAARCHDLFLVAWRHCDDAIGNVDCSHQQLAALPIVNLALVTPILLRKDILVDVVEQVVCKPKVHERPLGGLTGILEIVVVHLRVRKVALIAHVVNDEEAPRWLEHAPPPVVRRKDEGDQTSLPVIGDEDDLFAKRSDSGQQQGSLNRSPREEAKAEHVVKVLVASRVAVHACTFEAAILHEDAIYTNLGRVGVPSDLCRAPHVRIVHLVRATVQREASADLRGHGTLIVRVGRSNSHDTVPAAAERDGELVGDVCKSARLGEGRDLARDDDDLQPRVFDGRDPLLLRNPCCNLLFRLLRNHNRFLLNHGCHWHNLRCCLRQVLTHLEVRPFLCLLGDL